MNDSHENAKSAKTFKKSLKAYWNETFTFMPSRLRVYYQFGIRVLRQEA
jgi:hypothetical protein